MKHRRLLIIHSALFLLTALVCVLSWIGSVYGWQGVNNILSGEGLRWFLHSLTDRYLNSPFLGEVTIMAFGIGLFARSGLFVLFADIFKGVRKPSRKEKRALTIAAFYALLYLIIIAILALGPSEIVRSVTGSLRGSALASGSWFLLSLGIGSLSVVYAYSVDSFNSHLDIVRGMTHGVVIFAPFFVALFFICQFFTILLYTGIHYYIGIPEQSVNILYQLCSILSIIFTF